MDGAPRIGVFGGTFDPPHVGHLLVAVDALEALGLARLVLIPAATQPLKAGVTQTPAALRLAMVRALVADDPRFVVDPIEIERGGLSYTADTLAALRERWPAATLVLLAGADVLDTFHRWREPERVRALAQLVVLTRAPKAAPPPAAPAAGGPLEGPPDPPGTTPGEEPGAWTPAVPPAFPGGPPLFLQTRRVDVSSTEVRARLAAGRSIRGFVPESVADLIRSAGLYR